LDSIFANAKIDIYVFPDTTHIIDNYAKVLQYKAFRTLITYVNSKSNLPSNEIPSYSDLRKDDFLLALKHPSSYFLVSENNSSGITDDYVKWAQSLANYARAIDLYLAFEISVDVYDHNNADQLLLSMAEKETQLS